MRYTNIELKYPADLTLSNSPHERHRALALYGARLLNQEGYEALADILIKGIDGLKYYWQYLEILDNFFELVEVANNERPRLLHGHLMEVSPNTRLAIGMPCEFDNLGELATKLNEIINTEIDSDDTMEFGDFNAVFRLIFSDGVNQKFYLKTPILFGLQPHTCTEFVHDIWRLQAGLHHTLRNNRPEHCRNLLGYQENLDQSNDQSIYLRRLYLYDLRL